jgi:hypothetical protein
LQAFSVNTFTAANGLDSCAGFLTKQAGWNVRVSGLSEEVAGVVE